MISQDIETLRNVSTILARVTVSLIDLEEEKQCFVRQIDWKISELFQKFQQIIGNEQISDQLFAQKFSIKRKFLQFVLFKQSESRIAFFTEQTQNLNHIFRIQSYLKLNRKDFLQIYSTKQISQTQVERFILIVKNQIQIWTELREIFEKYSKKVEKIFQEIDFFNNQYIDCASLIEFFKHYSSDSIYSQKGCILLIKMIKGSQFSSDKLFYEDLIEFMQKNFDQEEQIQGNIVSLKKEEIQPLISHEEIRKFLSVQQQKNNIDNNFPKTNIFKFQLNKKQSSPDHSIPESNDSKLMDLSMSQSLLSPSSAKLGNMYIPTFDSIFQTIPSHFSSKRNSNFLQQLSNKKQNCQKSQQKHSKKIGQRDFAKVSLFQNQKRQQQQTKEFLHDGKSNNGKISILKQQPLTAKYKGFYQQKSQIPFKNQNLERKKQTKATKCINQRNSFESSLIKAHYRNEAYLQQVKLMSNSFLDGSKEIFLQKSNLKVFQSNGRQCLQGKVSIFQNKKLEMIYSMQFLSEWYQKWYTSLKSLIIENENFNFVNAFNVIDVRETNNVTFDQFLQFLKQCQIEKISQKIDLFFQIFSTSPQKQVKQPLKDDLKSNKQNIFIKEQAEKISNRNKQQIEKVMRFSDFLKIFCLQRAKVLIKKCKDRPAKIQLKWDQKMRESYCQFISYSIDSVYEIHQMKKQTSLTYLQMRKIWGQQTFQKTFDRQILRFEELQKILQRNCLALLCEISTDDQYIDEEKFLNFLNVQFL